MRNNYNARGAGLSDLTDPACNSRVRLCGAITEKNALCSPVIQDIPNILGHIRHRIIPVQ
jgi:hypothetical protein